MILNTIPDLLRSRKNLYLDRSVLEEMQIKKLGRLLKYAYDNVPFYHTKLKDAGISPDDVRTIDDLRKIPLTTKKELQRTPLNQIVAKGINVDACVRSRTSGSTGLPLETLSSRKADSHDAVMWDRAFFRNGMRLRDKMVVIRDPRNFQKKSLLEHFGIMRKKYVSIFDEAKTQAGIIARERPDIIESYPSSLEILANYFQSKNLSTKPRLIFTLAEFLDKRSRELSETVFETELFDYYGSSEIGLMSWECKGHDGYHINADNIIMEFVDASNETIASEEQGEIVCTNLNNYAMPLIRYMQGDIGAKVEGQCSCGIRLPLMHIIGGRKDDFLVTTNGRIIPPTVFFPYPFENFRNIEQFRVIQESIKKLRIQIVVKWDFSSEALEKARKEIRRVFGEEMEVEFEFLEKLARDPNGKIRKVVSKLRQRRV